MSSTVTRRVAGSRGAAIVVHESKRLRHAASAVLTEAGFVVFAAEDFVRVPEVILRSSPALTLVLVQYVMGSPSSTWRRMRQCLPARTVLLGLAEATGPGDTTEAVLVTPGERHVLGPLPIQALSEALASILGSRSSLRARRAHLS